MKILNVILATGFVLSMATTAFARTDEVTLQAGDSNFTSIPACGNQARVKAVYAKQSGHLVLRMCDIQWCKYPVILNTNAKFKESGDGKSEYYYSESQGKRLNSTCFEFELHNPTGTQKIRSIIGEDSYSENAAKITVE